MKQTLYLECYTGISGDMVVAALLDLGADEAVLDKVLASLPLDGFSTRISRVKRAGIDACDFAVLLDEQHENYDHDMEYLYGTQEEHIHPGHTHTGHMHTAHSHGEHGHAQQGHDHVYRGLKDILEIIDHAEMTEGARKKAIRIFHILAQAEAKAHGTDKEHVHFHEVGAVDSIVDIVAAAVCLDNLGIEETILPVLYEGTGFIRCQHGWMAIPVPAVAATAEAYALHLHITQREGELVTPTGAAIAAAIKTTDKLPDTFYIKKTGLGAGKRNYAYPSLLRAMLIETDEEEKARERDNIYKLETNIDDCTGEVLGYVMERLFEAGARDVYYSPIYMKKNRPAYQLSVICTEERVSALEKMIFKETTTIGIRRQKIERAVLKREIQTVQTSLGTAKVKVCGIEDGDRVYPEYESVRALSRQHDKSYQEVYQIIAEEYKEKLYPSGHLAAHDLQAGMLRTIRYDEKCAALFQKMKECTKNGVAVAFSGGVDSSLLLKLACEAADEGQKVYAITVHSRLHPAEDLETAAKVAEEIGAVHKIVFVDELKEADISDNPKERCYLCKKYIFQKMIKTAAELGVNCLVEGTNEDDLHVYRPGIQAIKELGILSPLAECGMTKKEIRELAQTYQISVAKRPSGPCLATRFPYETKLSYERMEQAEQGERFLRSLGFSTVRLRVHGKLARIEVKEAELGEVLKRKKEIIQYLKGLGYVYIAIDLEGFRSGSMDADIEDGEKDET
ncbi:nickel pincer cofactor biosynthesis protein LarC [Mediterraneibacter massiliensis]|uniref:nickel pincer cofactor biosynthesis protein LarC n=1 Tax=Mediterraneibacter massiliensis TaxID=1720300 RepID=UPI000E48FDCA|nr:nickel pincer cofactor biosynthesis protein LarC [Ruminococcus sp. AF18-22]